MRQRTWAEYYKEGLPISEVISVKRFLYMCVKCRKDKYIKVVEGATPPETVPCSCQLDARMTMICEAD